MIVNPKEVSIHVFHNYMLGAVTPRPIALVSSIDKEGNVNLSPFSFFNCFGVNPPILVFSPSRRVRDNTTKHTYENVLEVPEVVVHIVNYPMVQQTSLSSTEYGKRVNEFVKAGFTEIPSKLVRPPRVKEAPVAMECKVLQVIRTGEGPGAGNLVLCEVLLMHLDDSIMGGDGKIDPFRLDAVSRLGGNWYGRVQGSSIFAVPKPLDTLGIGIDNLPAEIRTSSVLTGNELARLANVTAIPEYNPQHPVFLQKRDTLLSVEDVHRLVQDLISRDNVDEAWQILLEQKQKT